MKNDRKKKLRELGAERLADALLELAERYDAADNMVERLIVPPKSNVQRFRRKLSRLKDSQEFISWKEVFDYARELETLLQDLKEGVSDPIQGVELVASFFEADVDIFDHCDDSSGSVGDVFRFDAQKLFKSYALRCTDKEKVAEIILKVNRADDYGVRDVLIDCAGEFLPESVIRTMIGTLQERADEEHDEYRKSHHLRLIESLARQIRDGELFEKTRIASWGTLSTSAYIDIARVYLESGDVQTAYARLQNIPEHETFKAHERDNLLTEIYSRLGDTEKLTDILYRKFRSHRSLESLQELLHVVGSEKRTEIIAEEVSLILKNSELRLSDAMFLTAIEKIDDAGEYLLKRADQIDGDFYGSLLPLAAAMEEENRYLAASLIYRSLLDSILTRGYTRAYPHGIRYLKKLDTLAAAVTDWKSFTGHEKFKEQLYQNHGRKRSFWSKYRAKK